MVIGDKLKTLRVTLVINPAVPQLSPQDKQSTLSIFYRDSLFAGNLFTK